MKLLDAIQQSGRPFEIPDCGRDDLPEFFKEMGFKVGVEIGVKAGDFSEVICKAGLKLYGIDPWLIYPDFVEPAETQEDLDKAMEKTMQRMKGYDFIPLKKTSMEAVKKFEDGSLDFVYIDGNHSFKYVTEDIFEWSKKVKKGGIISGHDYVRMAHTDHHHVHVTYVVGAYTEAMRLPNWYVLGRKKTIPGEKRDRWRSWFWINL